MKIEASGPNGETFEATMEREGNTIDQCNDYVEKEWERMREAFQMWLEMIKATHGKDRP